MYKFILTAQGKTFLFDFDFNKPEYESEEGQNSPCCYVEYTLVRKDIPKETWFWKGYICYNKFESFELSFPDNINITGNLKLWNERGLDYIFMDVHYGYNLESHFEGNIMTIPEPIHPSPIPIPPAPPSPVPPPVSPQDEDIIVPSGYNDLFPYLYLKQWPNLSTMEQFYFSTYTVGAAQSPPISSNLYASLLTNFNTSGLPVPSARDNITAAAFDFVNGTSPYENQYVHNTDALAFPFNGFPVIYDTLQHIDCWERDYIEQEIVALMQLEVTKIKSFLLSAQYASLKDQVWQNIFALVIINFFNKEGLENDIKIILVCSLLEGIILHPQSAEEEAFQHLIKGSIVLPKPVFPLPLYNASPQAISQIENTVVPYALGDLQIVQNRLIGYRTGEIAHIENVLPGELKERRNSTSQEINESSIDIDDKLLEEQTATEGSLEGLSKEILSTLNGTQNEKDDYSKLSTSYGPPTTGTYNGSVSFDTTINNTDNTSDNLFAKRILDKTVARMSRNIKRVFQKSQTNRTEEAVTHTLDNREGAETVRGIYSWVNKVYAARVVNYGKRFLLEFIIEKPLPHSFGQVTALESSLIPPSERIGDPILSFQDVTRDNYAILAAEYGVNNISLPPSPRNVSYALLNEEKVLTAQMLNIESGYVPSHVDVNYNVNSDMILLVGESSITLSSSASSAPALLKSCSQSLSKDGYAECNINAVPILLNTITSYSSPPSSNSFYISIALKSSPSENTMNQWRIAVYDAVMLAYQSNRAAAKQSVVSDQTRNKDIRKQWINTAIIDSCKAELYQVYLQKSAPTQPTLSPPVADVNMPAYYQFFDSAVEWKESTYEFSNNPSHVQQQKLTQSAINMYQEQPGNQYLDNTQIRIMVPVTPAFNYRMLYYLGTGIIANTDDPLTPVLQSAQHIAVGLKNTGGAQPKSFTDGSWEILVPTNMQWLQNGSELPCFNENDEQL